MFKTLFQLLLLLLVGKQFAMGSFTALRTGKLKLSSNDKTKDVDAMDFKTSGGDHQLQPESPHALVLPKDPRDRMVIMHGTPSSEKSAAPHPRSTVEATEMAVEKAMSDALI
ncbi:hypothetical protein PGT21_022245 [Puccinia graminis f. sp. tritici]|uniref:Uncharacterized protein n=1 Tax=Puccinia graminis f. sp. tritici TaxID=56615 RepID=A0A5B0PSZ2_PUCGR|nr:hypothetical protein PGTUg99_029485 [Puccinia graminis f. sp. tritici]KAA1104401.1 hypothetical protein PGT21_022245 [Puccinia graminis f. sp. tritici]